jgi:hypothetical protein
MQKYLSQKNEPIDFQQSVNGENGTEPCRHCPSQLWWTLTSTVRASHSEITSCGQFGAMASYKKKGDKNKAWLLIGPNHNNEQLWSNLSPIVLSSLLPPQ